MKIKHIKKVMETNRESHFRIIWDRDAKNWNARIEGCIEDVKLECEPKYHTTMKSAINSLNNICKDRMNELKETDRIERKLLKKYNPEEF